MDKGKGSVRNRLLLCLPNNEGEFDGWEFSGGSFPGGGGALQERFQKYLVVLWLRGSFKGI